MDKYNANEILNEVRKRAVVVSSQMTADQAVRLDEFPDRIQEHYPVLLKTNYQNNPDFFTIAVQEIPAGVCRHLLSEEPQMSVRLLLNSTVVTADTNCPTGTSEVGFVFERTLRQGESTKGCGPACGDGQVCNMTAGVPVAREINIAVVVFVVGRDTSAPDTEIGDVCPNALRTRNASLGNDVRLAEHAVMTPFI